jgi:glycosyltransferase involved in cell wall biosynthesis
VFEQALSHVVHGNNLERAVGREPDIAASVIRVEHRDGRPTSRLPGLRSWSFEASWQARTALRKRLGRRRADAVFIHTQVASLLSVGVMRDVPTVISMDATPINYDSVGESYGHSRQAAPVEWAKRGVNRRALAAANAIVVWSQWTANSVVGDYRIPEHKVHVIRPGVDLQRFRPGPQAEPTQSVRILFVGGDFVRKGGDDLIEAMRQLGPSAELDIITTSPPAGIPSGLTVRTHVGLGHDSEEFFDLYRRADVFALPSRGDCSPHVIAEALASGLPVIVTEIGAVAEMVADGKTGFLIPAGRPRRLAEKLGMLIEHADMRQAMGTEARRMAEREHDGGRNAQAIFELMRHISGTRDAG